MSERDRKDAELERDVVRALRAGGELIPVSDEEVLAAERELESSELELPESLREYRGAAAPGRGAVVRGPWLGYAAASLLGAAAASLLWFTLQPEKPHDLSGAGRDLVRPSASAPKRPTIPMSVKSCADECCAGADCSKADSASRDCPSGQRCISCAAGQNEGPFRLRLGAMVLTEAGEKLLEPSSGAPLELCVVTPGAPLACVAALSGGTSDDQWRLLGRVLSAQDLLSGLTVEVRRQGEASALASWKHPVVPAAEVFCKGLAIQPRDKEVVGRVSAFLEQTHFVELAHATSLAELRERQAEYEFHGIEPRIYETTQADRRFALVLGPLDKQRAQALRWAALEGGKEASVAFGLDFVGPPRPRP
jgi:hypothetical protein